MGGYERKIAGGASGGGGSALTIPAGTGGLGGGGLIGLYFSGSPTQPITGSFTPVTFDFTQTDPTSVSTPSEPTTAPIELTDWTLEADGITPKGDFLAQIYVQVDYETLVAGLWIELTNVVAGANEVQFDDQAPGAFGKEWGAVVVLRAGKKIQVTVEGWSGETASINFAELGVMKLADLTTSG